MRERNMNVSTDFKCDVCGKITRIKIQMGWLDKYPINIKCKECNISIFGECNLNIEGNKEFLNLKNVTQSTTNQSPDFLIEVSGELLTEKIRDYTGNVDMYISPFIKNMANFSSNGDEIKFIKYKNNVTKFRTSIQKNWSIIKRINELWINRNYKYLPNELHKLLNSTEYPADNELEYLRGVHRLNLTFLNPIFTDYYYKNTVFLFKKIRQINEANPKGFKDLVMSFEKKLNIYEEKIYKIIDSFTEKFEMFIPILSLDYYTDSKIKEEQIESMCLTTVDFENIKGYYIDTFEDIVGLFDLVVAYENLFERNDYEQMDLNVNNQIKTLTDFQKMSKKGKKIEFIDSLKAFDEMFIYKVENRIRNAIGHRSYVYDVPNQLIHYYSSGEIDKGEKEQIYLTQFVYNCFKLFETCMGIGELIYQTRKFYFCFNGVKIRSSQDYYPSNIN